MDRESKICLASVGGVVIAGYLGTLVSAELHPLAGSWEVERLTRPDGTVEIAPASRIYMDLTPAGTGSVANYWVCGERSSCYGEGKFRVEEGEMRFYDYNWATKETSEVPNLRMTQLPRGRFGLNLFDDKGPYTLVFKRDSNASTLLDYLFWR